MAMVEGIQRRSPFSHSSLPSSTYDKYIDSDEFVVEKYPADQIRVFFRRAAAHSEGVGLLIPSPGVALSLARVLLTVAEGHSSTMTASLLSPE
jgi:hypothetical protein